MSFGGLRADRRKEVGIGFFLVLAVLLSGIASVQAAGSAGTDALTPLDAAASVYISGYTVNPEVFFPYETGTVIVYVTNPSNMSIGVSQPNLIDPHVTVTSTDVFSTMTTLGPGSTTAYPFVITVDGTEGSYFPLFTVSPKIYGSSPIHGQIRIRVDATDIRTAVVRVPDNFAILKKDLINVSVTNPRDGNITDLMIVPEGTGVNITPLQSYTGLLPAQSSVEVSFAVTPVSSRPALSLHTSYRNGDNRHAADIVVPMSIGEDRTASVPVINNIAISTPGNYYDITGDVNNAGITDAQSLVVTVGSPAQPVEPYPEYAVGTLASGDFSSFELTFTTGDLSAVPVRVSWKDLEGNSFASERTIDLQTLVSPAGSGSSGSRSVAFSGTGSAGNSSGGFGGPGGGRGPQGGGAFFFGGGRSGGLSAFYPVIAGAVILVIAAVLYTKRKWIAARLKRP